MESIRTHVEACLVKYRGGALEESDLQRLLELLDAKPPRQSLLYLQARSSSPYSGVIGIHIFEETQDLDGIDAQGKPLYRTIREALEDGWRIVKFPEMTLAMEEQNTYGLGYEFILERWR